MPSGTELPASAEEHRMGNHTSALQVGHQKGSSVTSYKPDTCLTSRGSGSTKKTRALANTKDYRSCPFLLPPFVSFIPSFSSFFLSNSGHVFYIGHNIFTLNLIDGLLDPGEIISDQFY